ncbi:hypothetical protein EAF07_04875 [Streptococcus hillyeri]|uniref:Uncharacterized protein n=1 Tax=Streptococcus hillyeri TaxID=2282420 RepID=A0A3L9DUP1_9STRE|nr:hypothetical protein EAF07_04875 [Streptococcus hillyeri]
MKGQLRLESRGSEESHGCLFFNTYITGCKLNSFDKCVFIRDKKSERINPSFSVIDMQAFADNVCYF